ncbi:MAG: GNAT family N-acetyltransferase [Desulfobacterales bacterium]
MTPRARAESPDALRRLALSFPSPFTLPAWVESWHEAYAPSGNLWVRSFHAGGELLGAAALRIEGDRGLLAGDPEVCDHLDLIAAPGRERPFARAVLETVRAEGIGGLDLFDLRPDAVALTALAPAAQEAGLEVVIEKRSLLFAMDLPHRWEDYLAGLPPKERHEVRRKLRRFEERASASFRLLAGKDEAAAAVETFLSLFRRSRRDKAEFLTEQTKTFFRLLALRLPEFRLGLVHIDGVPAAAVFCFDHHGTRYLYNSAYDLRFAPLGAGMACKILSIRDAVARGLSRYDFLKGEEPYKRRLGGKPLPLFGCRIELGA